MRIFRKKERYGALINPIDPRDYPVEMLIEDDGLPYVASKKIIDYESLLGQVHYQGQVPSCTAFAAAHQIYLFERIHNLSRASFPSPAFIYSGARYWRRSSGGKYWTDGFDKRRLIFEGTYPRAAYQWMAKTGICPEVSWPYSEKKEDLNKLPNRLQMKMARGRAGLKYYDIDAHKTQNIRLMLDNGYPPTMSVPVTKAWTQHNTTEWTEWNVVVYNNKLQTTGLHRVCCVGYRPGYIKIANSWRTQEYLWLNDEYIDKCATDITVIKRV